MEINYLCITVNVGYGEMLCPDEALKHTMMYIEIKLAGLAPNKTKHTHNQYENSEIRHKDLAWIRKHAVSRYNMMDWEACLL